MTPLVTVVVPVYNAGLSLESGVSALLGQTMSTADFEVIYVDDGSTDGSGARLDELAAEHPHISVHHIPNSGWPGRPRNIGIDNARGHYVQFMDQDDALGSEALERLYAFATVSDADIVVGKVASDFRPVLHELFRSDQRGRTLRDFPLLIRSLTPHKMFRVELLREHGIRFPEGPRRLEDQPFVTAAYFAATSIGVLSSYVCYLYQKREDGQNSAAGIYEPRDYYRYLREVLDIVEEHTEPGEFRNVLMSRWMKSELIGRLRGPLYVDETRGGYREEHFKEVRRLVEERFDDEIIALLTPALRVRAHLMQTGDDQQIGEHWRAYDKVRPDVTLESMRWRDGALELKLSALMRDEAGTGDPLAFEVIDGRYYLTDRQLGMPIPLAVREATDGVEAATAEMVLREASTYAEYYVPGDWVACVEEIGDRLVTVRVTGTVTLDPATVLFGDPLRTGSWRMLVRLTIAGWNRTVRIGVSRADEVPNALDELYLVGARTRVSVTAPDDENVALRVAKSPAEVEVKAKLTTRDRATVLEVLPPPLLAVAARSVLPTVTLELRRIGTTPLLVTVPGRLDPNGTITVALPRRTRVLTRGVSLGRWRLRLVVSTGTRSIKLVIASILQVPGRGAIALLAESDLTGNEPAPLLRRVRRIASR